MAFEVRRITDDEFHDWIALAVAVFGEEPRVEDTEAFGSRVEPDRSRAAFEGDEMVGTAAEFSYQMTVPGGSSVPTAGITVVTVKPTHRRRGVLTRMMEAQLRAAVERREPLAALWASESTIYGRFGFAPAIHGADFTIARHHTTLESTEPLGGRMRLVGREEAEAVVPGVYRRATAGIPGTIARSEGDWTRYFYDPEHHREGRSAMRYALFEGDGGIRGYVRYRQKPDWTDHHPDHRLTVADLQAVDAEAYAALFRYVFSIDLVTEIRINNRRVFEPLSLMLADPRRMRAEVTDRIWLRILDVPGVLGARRYPVEGRLVIAVVDDFDGVASGRYLLEGGPEGASCAATTRAPDLTINAADLASICLGEARLASLAWIGRVEGDEPAVRLGQSMFSWHIDPWCTVGF